MELNGIMTKYGTDKQRTVHDYVQFYEKYFEPIKNQKLKILEIGIYRPPMGSPCSVGASLKTWYEYFPNSQIIGSDVHPFTDIENNRIKTIISDQSLRTRGLSPDGVERNGLEEIILEFGSNFDIIIDDGGHNMKQQQVTLGHMFKHLKPNGIFVIEDLHTSYFAPSVYNSENKYTTLSLLNDYINEKKIKSDYILDEEKKYLIDNIKEMVMHKGNQSEIVFITKK
jgi:hypothetical protein